MWHRTQFSPKASFVTWIVYIGRTFTTTTVSIKCYRSTHSVLKYAQHKPVVDVCLLILRRIRCSSDCKTLSSSYVFLHRLCRSVSGLSCAVLLGERISQFPSPNLGGTNWFVTSHTQLWGDWQLSSLIGNSHLFQVTVAHTTVFPNNELTAQKNQNSWNHRFKEIQQYQIAGPGAFTLICC